MKNFLLNIHGVSHDYLVGVRNIQKGCVALCASIWSKLNLVDILEELGTLGLEKLSERVVILVHYVVLLHDVIIVELGGGVNREAAAIGHSHSR